MAHSNQNDTDRDDKVGHIDHTKAPSDGEAMLARQLTGELYCIGCGYNLHGLSIRSNCSECGIPVRATILGIVDPHAEELVPLIAPRLIAIGLNAWSMGALLALAMVWLMRGAEMARDAIGANWIPTLAPFVGIGGLVVSMLGGAMMIRPHRGVLRLEAIRSAFGVSLFVPLIFVYGSVYMRIDALSPSPVFEPGSSAFERSILRVLMLVLVAGIIWGLRPQAVGLAIRSIVVRTGRVDRQSLYAVLASLAIAAIGDVIHIINHFFTMSIDDMLSIVALVVVSLGSVLFSVGMVNICIDTIRLYPVLVRPGVGLSDIFETNKQKSERTNNI